MNWRLQNPKGFRENIHTFNELASPKSKGFRKIYIQMRAFDELASPKSKELQGNIYTFNELASPKSKGFQGKYIYK